MSLRDEIKLEGGLLAVGESRRIVCPSCHGGESRERSMNIQRTSEGVLYKCHRASCDARGFTGASAAVLSSKPIEREPDLYDGELLPLEGVDIDFFSARYELPTSLSRAAIFRNEHDEYVLPIYNPGASIRGYNIRQPWAGAPRSGRRGRPKSRVYMESHAYPVQSVYEGDRTLYGTRIVLVEDQLSAMKAASHASVTYGIALMGAYLDIPRVKEISMLRPQEVLLALDADATETAFKLAREFGLAFPRMRVVILDQDLKDTPAKEIDTVLGV